jgi:DNA-directed RNA polymerase specialized sigma24 family protein
MAAETGRAEDGEVAELLAACARQDRQAFQRLYERTASQLLACLIRVLRDRALAAESYADVDEIPGEDGSADVLGALGQRARKALTGCLEALQPRQRECIVLAYQGGLSHAEVATEIGEPLGSVKSWIRRGLTALKRCLES